MTQVRITVCTFAAANFFTAQRSDVLGQRRNTESRKEKVTVEKHQIGRERPHFFGFQPPKNLVGSLPPSGTINRARRFFHGDRKFEGNTHHPVAVGTGIAPRPPHGPGRARLTHPVLIAGRMRTDRGSHEHPL